MGAGAKRYTCVVIQLEKSDTYNILNRNITDWSTTKTKKRKGREGENTSTRE